MVSQKCAFFIGPHCTVYTYENFEQIHYGDLQHNLIYSFFQPHQMQIEPLPIDLLHVYLGPVPHGTSLSVFNS